MNRPELTLVIPTYNEGDIIEASLKAITGALGDMRSRTEVIIADDGADDLPEVIERCRGSFGLADIRVMRNRSRIGKGKSIGLAFGASRGDIVGFIDVDLSVAPSYIHAAVERVRSGDQVCVATRVGDRFKTDGSFVTSVIATIFTFIHRRLIFGGGRSFNDTQCGFKFFRKDAALLLYKDIVASDGLTDLEVLLKAVRLGYRISELEVPRRNDRVGKRKISSIFVSESLSLCRIFCRYRLGL